MSDAGDLPGAGVSESFIEQVKQVLDHLYDFSYLHRHSLAQLLVQEPGSSGETPAQFLRREALLAVEALGSGPGAAFRAPHARLHNLLHLRYVEGLTVQEAANELGISLRQAYRDLRHGEESVAAILWDRCAGTLSQEPRAHQLSSIEAEVERLELHAGAVEVRNILRRAHNAVTQLALQRGIDFESAIPAETVIIPTDEVIAQQVLIGTLSHAIQQAMPGRLVMSLTSDQMGAMLTLTYTPITTPEQELVVSAVISQLAHRLGWSLRQEDKPAGERVISVQMIGRGPTILVIDDNEGLVDLVCRYLSSHACRVVAATSGEDGLRLAGEITPDAILLDVMMPQKDGWETLQTLRARPATASIPVIICSVFNDPELAYSLGASLVLPKPVQRDGILKALRDLEVV